MFLYIHNKQVKILQEYSNNNKKKKNKLKR